MDYKRKLKESKEELRYINDALENHPLGVEERKRFKRSKKLKEKSIEFYKQKIKEADGKN